MIKAIIIDDESHCIQTLQEKIKIYCPSIEVQASFTKPQKAIEYLEENSPDLVFLDIEMPIINGFSLLEKIKEINFKIVFTTAYDQFGIKAIKFSAFDYLLKPIDKDELIAMADKLNSQHKNYSNDEQLKVLLQQLQNTNTDQIKISVPTFDGIFFPFVKDIVRVESSNNYSTLYFTNGKKLIVSKTLKDFEDLLVSYNFFRVHNSHLINIKMIKKYNKADGGSIELENGDVIEISRRRKDDFLKLIG